jgi:hypothetical protein
VIDWIQIVFVSPEPAASFYLYTTRSRGPVNSIHPSAFCLPSKNTPNMNTLWSFFSKSNQAQHDQAKDAQSDNNNGFPVPNPTSSYWRSELHPIDSYCTSEELPPECDIAIIGAGMTGVSTAYHLSRLHDANPSAKKPSIVILDAREVCSGATGRNGVCRTTLTLTPLI